LTLLHLDPKDRDDKLRKYVKLALEAKGPELFRLAIPLEEFLKNEADGMDVPDSAHYRYYQGYREDSRKKLKEASEIGSVEATLHLARTSKSYKKRCAYYRLVFDKFRYPGGLYELASYQAETDGKREDADETWTRLIRLGDETTKKNHPSLVPSDPEKKPRKRLKEETAPLGPTESDGAHVRFILGHWA